jgi:4-amino-4-deoxychorismate lyase
MAIFLLKKSYQLNNLKEIKFNDLWGDHGVFTTMWIFNKPFKILFFKDHIENLVKSAKVYGIKKNDLKKIIFKLLKENLSNSKNYNHLLRIALNRKSYFNFSKKKNKN